MHLFVDLWTYLAGQPLFCLISTVVAFWLACQIYERSRQAPWAEPVRVSVTLLSMVLAWSNTLYQTYFAGAHFLHFLLGPAFVALAWPLWQRALLIREHLGKHAACR